LIALLPLFPVDDPRAVSTAGQRVAGLQQLRKDLRRLYHGFILRTVVFFGCAWIFMNLFRGELVDRSLHYYFLSAVRREVLVAASICQGL
jgi:hypothetical protein